MRHIKLISDIAYTFDVIRDFRVYFEFLMKITDVIDNRFLGIGVVRFVPDNIPIFS